MNAAGGAAHLTENGSFLVSLHQTFTIPELPQTLSVDLLSLGLEVASSGIPDAFEISLLDGSDNSLVPAFRPGATSFFQVRVVAVDNRAVTSLALIADDVPIELDAGGNATLTNIAAGVLKLQAVALDAAGNSGTASREIRVFDPADLSPPVITVTSPPPGDVVTYLTTLVGSVTDEYLDFYEVAWAPKDSGQLTPFARGTSQIVDAELGVFDPTLIPNDQYDIRITARDLSGNINWLVGSLFGSYPFRSGTRVYINPPDGRRGGFTFDPLPVPGLLGTFNPAHELIHEVRNGQATDYTYDPAGQLTAAIRAGQPDESYDYDANGNRTALGYQVGPANRLLSDGAHDYAYDAGGNLVRKTNIATVTITSFDYDHRNRLVAVDTRDSGGALLQRVEFTYDLFDRRIAKTVDPDAARPQPARAIRFYYAGGNGRRAASRQSRFPGSRPAASESATAMHRPPGTDPRLFPAAAVWRSPSRGGGGPVLLLTSRSTSTSWVTWHQCRILSTIFLPTPNRTRASSSENSVGHEATPRTPSSSQPYRNTNVWCPENLYFWMVVMTASGALVRLHALAGSPGMHPTAGLRNLELA